MSSQAAGATADRRGAEREKEGRRDLRRGGLGEGKIFFLVLGGEIWGRGSGEKRCGKRGRDVRSGEKDSGKRQKGLGKGKKGLGRGENV